MCPKQLIALFNCEAHINRRIDSAGGRAGWSMGTWLPYVTGGYAETRFRGLATNRSLVPTGAVIEQWNAPAKGWYIGGGVDWAYNPSLVFGVEYRHYDFGDRTVVATGTVGGVPGSPLPNDTAIFSTKADTLSLRVSYLLNVWRP